MRKTNLLLVVISLAVGLFLCEAGYRVWLVLKLERMAQPLSYDPKPTFGIYNPPPWRFDREAGFAYIPNLAWWTANIIDGEFQGCSQPYVMTNEQGNIGKIIGSYDDAEIKILVFGDSFATMHFNGDTWPNLFQRQLEKVLGKRVHVVNFGRDSYGVLQMVDLAAREVPKWKPHYVVIAFITNDLVRPRYWRVIRQVGEYWRFLMAMEPDENIMPSGTTTNEGAIISPKITREWCEAIMARMAGGDQAIARTDPVVRELVTQYNEIRRGNPRSILKPEQLDFWSIRSSFLYNRIIYRDTFPGLGVKPQRVGYGAIELDDFHGDTRFLHAVETVRASGAKVILVHFPVRPEIEEGIEYLWKKGGMMKDSQGMSLVRSLEEAFGSNVLALNEYLKVTVADFTPYIQSPQDWHPNAKGIEVYAQAVTTALINAIQTVDQQVK